MLQYIAVILFLVFVIIMLFNYVPVDVFPLRLRCRLCMHFHHIIVVVNGKTLDRGNKYLHFWI